MAQLEATSKQIGMDALDRLFASDNEDSLPFVPDLDLDRVEREARAKARAVLNVGRTNIPEPVLDTRETGRKRKDRDDDEDEEGAKKRKPLPKIDPERLLGPYGFPALIEQTKNFKPKGKGQEKEDLNRIMTIYQLWAHRMFPKRRFNDTVERVEKVCRSRGMVVALSTWKDNALNPDKAKNSEPIGEVEEVVSDDDGDRTHRAVASSGDARPSSDLPTQSKNQEEVDEDDEAIWAAIFDRMKSNATSAPTDGAPTNPAAIGAQASGPSSMQDDEDAFLDALIREENAINGNAGPKTAVSTTTRARAAVQEDMSQVEEDEDALWAQLMEEEAATVSAAPPGTKPASPTLDEEDELLRMMDETEGPSARVAPSAGTKTTTLATAPGTRLGETTPAAPVATATLTPDEEEFLRIGDKVEIQATARKAAEQQQTPTVEEPREPVQVGSTQEPAHASAVEDDWDDIYK